MSEIKCKYQVKLKKENANIIGCVFSGECEKKAIILGNSIEITKCTRYQENEKIAEFLNIYTLK